MKKILLITLVLAIFFSISCVSFAKEEVNAPNTTIVTDNSVQEIESAFTSVMTMSGTLLGFAIGLLVGMALVFCVMKSKEYTKEQYLKNKQ